MRKSQSWILVGCALYAAALYSPPAHAAAAVEQGTMRLAAERLVFIGARVDDPNAQFELSLLPSLPVGGTGSMQFPRVGFDYFVIDGLSLGGSAGLGYFSSADLVAFTFLPRVGYAFELTKSLDFWPRGGIGWATVSAGPLVTDSAILTLEGMFQLEMVPHALFQFGPILDVAFSDAWPIETGATAGLVIEF